MLNAWRTASGPISTAAHADAVSLRRWVLPLARVFALLGAAACLYAMRQVDPDLYGYLAYGRLFVERGSLSGPNPFALHVRVVHLGHI